MSTKRLMPGTCSRAPSWPPAPRTPSSPSRCAHRCCSAMATPPPIADAADHGDRRLRRFDQGAVRRFPRSVINLDVFLRRCAWPRTPRCRLDKRPLAGAGQNDHTHLRVALEVGDDVGHRAPHLVGHGVVLFRLVEDHPADTAILAGDHLGCAEVHAFSPLRSFGGGASRRIIAAKLGRRSIQVTSTILPKCALARMCASAAAAWSSGNVRSIGS